MRIHHRGARGAALAIAWLATHAGAQLSEEPQSEPAASGWIELRTPAVVVYSDAGEPVARSVLEEFSAVRAALDILLPGARLKGSEPVRIVAVAGEAGLSRFAPDLVETFGAYTTGLYVRGWERQYAVVRTDVGSTRVGSDQDSVYFEVLRHYGSALVDLNRTSLPRWLSEGLADLLASAQLGAGEVRVGRYLRNHIVQLRHRFPTLETLLTDSEWTPAATSVLGAASWALTHHVFFDRAAAGPGQLTEFMDAYESGTPSLDAARRAFGDLELLAAGAKASIEADTFNYGRFPWSENEIRGTARPLSPAEVLALEADVGLARGRLDAAEAPLSRALEQAPELAEAHETRGLLLWRQNRKDEARQALARAVELAPDSARARYFRAYSILAAPRLTVAEHTEARKHLRRAAELNDEFAAVHALLARILTTTGSLATAVHHARRALELEPSASDRWLELGRMLAQSGQSAEARAAGERALLAAESEAAREAARGFLASLTALAPE